LLYLPKREEASQIKEKERASARNVGGKGKGKCHSHSEVISSGGREKGTSRGRRGDARAKKLPRTKYLRGGWPTTKKT